MSTNGTPPPTWPIEPTLLFIVSYYPTNSDNQAPTISNVLMRDYNSAVDKAKELITNAGNVGVCTIQQVTSTIVFPSIPWQDW